MALHQNHYRFGVDELAENTHGWYAAEDTDPAPDAIPVDTVFLLRFCVQAVGAGLTNVDFNFQCRLNGGAYQNITLTSSIVQAAAAVALTNGGNCTKRLSGTGTFESSGAGQTEDGASGGGTNDIVTDGNSETEAGLLIVGADVGPGDVIEFRLLRDGGTSLDAYNVTPSISFAAAATTVTPDPVVAAFTATTPTVTNSAPPVVPARTVFLVPQSARRARRQRARTRTGPIVRAAGLLEGTAAGLLTPDPVVAAFTAVSPTVVKGGLTQTPATAIANFTATTPTVVKGALTVTPDAVVASFIVAAPTVVEGARILTPSAVVAAFTVTTPTVVRGVVTLTPSSVVSAFTATTPSAGGAATLTPASVAAAFSTTTPTIVTQAPPKRVAPIIAIGRGRRARVRRKGYPLIKSASLVVFGPQTVTPDSVAVSFSATTPTIVRGTRILNPTPIVASFATVAPLVSGGVQQATRKQRTVFILTSRVRARQEKSRRRSMALNVAIAYQPGTLGSTLTPSPVVVSFTATTPSVVRGTRTLTPSPVVASFTATPPKMARTAKPGSVAASFTAPSPAISTGNLKNPQPTVVSFVATTPTIVRGARTLTPDSVVAVLTATTPRVVRRQTPDPVVAAFSSPPPVVLRIRTIASLPVTVSLTATTPTILRGPSTLTPSPVAVVFSTTDPIGVFIIGLIEARRLGVSGTRPQLKITGAKQQERKVKE